MYLKAFFTKTTLWSVAAFCLLVGVFVYAIVDKTVYVTEQLVVIPDTVVSDTWAGVENILISDVAGDSLYQDFAPSNAAVLDQGLLNEATTEETGSEPDPSSDLPSEDTGVSEDGSSSGNVDEGNSSSETTEDPAETTVDNNEEVVEENVVEEIDEPEPEAAQEEDVTEPEPEATIDPEPTAQATSPFFGLLPTSTGIFKLTQETVVEEVVEVDSAPAAEVENESSTEETSTDTSTEDVAELDVAEDESELIVDESENPETEEVVDESSEVNGDESTEEIPQDQEGSVTTEEEVIEEEIAEEVVTTIYDACAGNEECKLYSTTFTGFSMPEFEKGHFLASAQLRLSLAAKTKPSYEAGPQRFVVEYSYEATGEWRTATVIDIEDEIANSINGGYFLVSLEKPLNQAELSNLQVRVSYQGDINDLDRAYIESLWLEVTSAEFYEETDPQYLSGAIDYSRDLLSPEFHELNNADLDPAMSELPSFTLSYTPQQNFIRRALTAVFSENEYSVDSVRVIDARGEVITVPVDVEYYEDKTWTVQFLEQPQKMVPGKYTIELVIDENETLYTDSFEFYWGVLAVNTTKSMYFPGEDVTLNLAALTEKGDTICDAALLLKVVDPDYTIYEIPVEQSGACGKNNVTDIPDYLAYFNDADVLGRYTIQLQHLNREGEVVHSIQDHFEVRDYIPYDIERTAPTRIYPPAPYDVTLKVKANRVFTGDIIERVPRGFIFIETSGAEVATMPDYTELVWRNVSLEEGDEIELTYQFDAPDISPYMYLLGPLNMDGFTELRQWQIASDALTASGVFSGTRTVAGTNLNQAASPIQWSSQALDPFYFDHSTSTDSHEVTLRQAGDYFLAVTVPQIRTDGNNSRTRVGVEVRVNGVAVPQGVGRSAYIRNQNGQLESSAHTHFLLTNIAPDDVLEVYLEGLTTVDAGDIVNVSGKASMFLEYVGTGAGVFAATTTQTTNSTNLNQTTEYAFTWTETRQDSGFVHSDSLNPEQIVISNPGTYYVAANIPMTTNTAQSNVLGRVRLDGAQVAGGQFKQGYAQSAANEGDGDSSMHWSGIVVATTTNQVLTFTATREAVAGTVTVTSGFVGSVYIQELPSTEVIALRGTAVVGGTNWNPAAAAAVQWVSQDQKDATVFTHSTSTNSHQITIAEDGDYFLSYNDAINGAVARANSRVEVLKNGTAISGAQAKSHYIRNQNGHTESSGALAVVLEGLVNGDVITVTTVQEAAAGTLNDNTDAILLMWKKNTLDLRPDAPVPTTPFDNIRFASSTPYFDFSANDPDGTSAIEYEFSIATTTGFTASTTFNSASDSEFFNTASSTDTSPFVESNTIRLQLTSGDQLSDQTTYYWRVRAKDVAGSGEFSDWSTTKSLTVDLAAEAPSWFQSFSGQFEGDSLIGTVSSGDDRVQVDASVSPEVLIAYGEGTNTTPRYRFWNGTSWGLEGSASAVSGTINWVKTAASVTRDEYALITLDSASDSYVQVYSASTSSWGNLALMSPAVIAPQYRGIAVSYESTSGDLMAVSCTNSPNPVYRIWNGTSWSGTSTIPVSSLNNCNFLDLASDSASDEMILVVRDTGTQYEALVWDGTAWVESRVIGSSAKLVREGMSVAYEASGDQAIIVTSNDINNNFSYTTWNGVEFSTNSTHNLGNDFEFGRLVADTDSDSMALCYIDEDNDMGVARWNGGVWATSIEIDTGGNADTARPVDCEFETQAGRSDYLMSVYSDTANVRYRAATSTVFNTEVTLGTMEDSFWVQTERAGNGTILAVALDDTVDNLNTTFWNGTSWAAQDTLETSPSSVIAAPYEMYDMSAKRFQFAEGIVETPPINFTDVPAQPTWGDINFTTTEPFGTDVLVRVKYSNVGTCDAYIPDIALPGNSAGFDVSDSPVDLVGVSTTTYDQICLEASLTTLGDDSASLEEWTLAWVRQPKLIQNRYRWYVNGSFLTPTDPWPVGVDDTAENTSIDSSIAINIDETVRLRMSLQGSNVELPAFAEAFKLQYAEGFTCSNSLTWHDVGDTASTTALWRGFENSIVGDDWYSASWGRRVRVSVDSGLVTGNQTDFPVYLNLADFPAEFFDNVQSDGDDIRVTEADGVTEVPYELVTIDTGADSGELHFKADISSTTDTAFFIYYGNGSASPYSSSATYGRNNVWTNGFLAVYHLDQSPTASAPQFVDSTGINTGTAVNLEVGDRLAGIVGRAIDLDGVDEYISTNVNQNVLRSTWSIWINPDGAQGAYDGILMSRGTLTNGININSTATRLGYHWRDAANTYSWNGAPLYPTSQWFMATLVVEPTIATMYSHSGGGTTVATNTVTHATATIDALSIGRDPFGAARSFNGLVDEVSLSNVVRSATWLSTTYNNKSNPTGFYSVSGEELINDGRLLPSTVLSESDLAETYEEENPTRDNQNSVPVGDDAEWDFVLENNGATAATNYCFRMVYEDGALLNTYNNYPRLITNAPPQVPELVAPFDNERLASTTPWFEFYADDELEDEIAYEIQVSTDYAFGSTVINNNSIASFALFTNLNQPAQKSQFTSGDTIQFISPTALSSGTTYWWRVRAQDPDGSGAYSEWSTPDSFTVTTGTTITTWYQTTAEQFATNNLLDAVVNTGDTGIDSGFSIATTTSTVIDYDDRDTGNAWGDFSFTNNVTSGSIDYFVEYRVSGETFALVPDVDLPGNSSGFNSSPVSLVNLNTTTYNELRLVAVLSGNSTLPRLQDWSVTWSETIEIPTLVSPFDNAKVSTTTPALSFFTTDPENDDLQYEVQLSSSYGFVSSSTFISGVNAGFTNTENGGDTSPFTNEDLIQYLVQAPLTNGNTYWWRVRARDPLGTNTWSDYSTPESFTVDTAITTSVWYQTTGEQFATDELFDIETTSGAAQITSVITEVITVYGEGTGQSPQYRLWNGTSWSIPYSAQSVGAQIRWLELKASPARPEYALGTLGTDQDVNFQIYNSETDTWGDMLEPVTTSVATDKRTFNLAYESVSGDLLAVACSGTDAVYSVWNGTSWSATSSLALTNAQNCEFVQIASDPTSDEMIVVFRHAIAATNDYEAFVWNGSSFGSATQFGELVQAAHEGMAVAYEESGGQAIVAVSNNANTTLLYNIWNGSSWSGTSTHALGDHLEWGTLKADVGTDRLALCYIDNDTDLGVVIWDGSTWGTHTELDIDGNDVRGRAIDCEWQVGTNDGDLLVAYSDTAAVRYQTFDTVFSGEFSVSVVTDAFEVNLARAGDGLVHLSSYDDAFTPDRIDHSRWNGSAWTTREQFSSNASLDNVLPYVGGVSMAPQIYPNFTSGSIRSASVDFADGTGPRWDYVAWSDTTPGASEILYRVYYESAPGTFSLIPDIDLPGNSTGFVTSPVDISAVNRTTYSVLQLDAQFSCVSGDCPSLQDWSVAWSEGITVSGIAREFDGTSTTTSGSVAVAVNGVLQPGKTGTILANGTWSISNVTAFPGDTVAVFVDGASDSDESVAVATYDGVGNITGMELTKRNVTVGSDSLATTTISGFAGYDNADDEDLFFTIGAGNAFTLCAEAVCADGKFKIKTGTIFVPGATLTTHDFLNLGTFRPATNTVRVSGGWNDQGVFVPETSTVIFSATSTAETIVTSSSTLGFYNATFGEGSGTATWTVAKPFITTNNLAVAFGTMARGTSTIAIGGNLQVGSAGYFSGLATTTFNGSGSNTWSDAKSATTSSNVGNVVIDGTTKTVTLAGNVGAESVTIGADDTLNASGSGFNINIVRSWVNNNAFVPQSGTVTFVGTSTGSIARGTSAFNNLAFTGVGGNWSFSTPTLALNGNMSIATGTVTFPTGTTTIAGSFSNTGGTFLHNNGEVRMTSTAGGRTISQSGTAFLNAFYDLVFAGTGSWTYSESAATTTRNFRIQSGSVTLPSGTLTVGGDYSVTGSGAFSHNSGQVILLVEDADVVRTNGSSFNNLRIKGGTGSWYNNSWSGRVPVTIESSKVAESVTEFPIYVNLADLPSTFFTGLQTDGDDIRVTTGDGVTEVPFELVTIDTVAESGELHFKGSLSSTTDTTFYIYYGNASASAYATTATYGRNSVWSNGYAAVYHMDQNPAGGAPQYVDSTGSTTGTTFNMEAGDQQAAQVGRGADLDGANEYVSTNMNRTLSTSTWSLWMRTDGAQGAYDGVLFSRGGQTTGINIDSTANRIGYHWNDAAATYTWSSGPVYPRDSWFMASLVVLPTQATAYVHATSGITSGTNTTTHGNSLINALNFGQDSAGGRFLNGLIDEVRISNVARTQGWLTTAYNNMASTTEFYAASASEAQFSRTFTDTNATVLGNLTLETGGDSTFNTGTLSVGGSFTNNAQFYANGGTVRFNSTGGAETVDAGDSSFATLTFDSATGDFTVTENATATVAINLTNAQQFTLSSGRVLSSLGTFTNAANGSNTTWTGSTLRLMSGTEITLNSKAHAGDVYATLEAASSTLARMWNSSATSYVTSGATGAIYSQDHSAVDGDLNIYGNYTRTTGTEHWSYATDFDGATLTGSERQVDVRVASSSAITIRSATLSVLGGATASTTIDALTNAFSLTATSSTVHSSNAAFAGTGLSGLTLVSSTTLGTFTNTSFAVVPGRSGITIDATTVNSNPADQFFNISFATTSAGVGTNVTLTGTPASYIWFRNGIGNLYGEAFDAGDSNPGAIRFDDSSYLITISGVVYSDDGVTPMGAPTCDGTTPNVRIVIDGGTYTDAVACNSGTGAFTFNNVAYVGDPSVVVYLNTNGGNKGSVVSKTPTTNISNFSIYANRVIVRHEDTSPLSIADMLDYDYSDDSDISFTAAVGLPNTLVLEPNTELYVFAGKSFVPAGNVTLLGNGNSNSYEGTLQIGAGASFVATGTETHTLSGRFVLASTTSSFTAASSTFVFNATTTGKSITSTNSVTFNEIQFTGVGGAWNITAPLIVQDDMFVAAGTVTGTSNITLQNGSLYGNGALSLGSGTTTIARSNTFGGTTAWTLNNLVLGNGSVTGTTTPATTATTTILGRLTIANAHFLDAGATVWDLAGTGTVFTETGTLLEDTSTIRYSGAGANVISTNYYNLLVSAGAGSATYTGIGSGILVLNDLTIGGGVNSTFTVNTTDQILEVRGDMTVASNGTFEASNSALLTMRGDFTNDGVFNGNGGTLLFNGTGTSNIAAGNAVLSNVDINGTGSYVVTENATSTGNWSLIAHSSFTVNSGATLAIGGAFLNNIAGSNTTWTGSTLRLYGTGTYEINDSATSDTYETISVAANTHIRMWNSGATSFDVNSAGSLYSQDHAGVDGDAYIYGSMQRTSGDDYWSYDQDFDGNDLSGGSERQAHVYFASGASALWSGTASLSVIGSSSATTTIENQGSGNYGIIIGTGATTEWDRVQIRDINGSGIVFAGAPTVVDFSRTDHLVEINSGSAITVGGTAINANEAKNFTNNIFNVGGGATSPKNVTATGTTISSWRFTNHSGNLAGESFDDDPAGDPGYIVWDDSAALVTVAGNVYSDEGVTVSGECDGVTNNVRLVVAGLTTYDTTCSAATGAYSISGVAFSPLDTLTLYLNDETSKAANVSVAPISSISNMHLYHNRVIVRHENTDPLTIANMAVWDSSDDADIPFTAVDAGSDTLSLPANTKLLVWTGKTFEPNGNVTLAGGGAGDPWDGTLEAQSSARFRAKGTEVHSIGGSVIFGSSAEFVSGSSTLTLTTSGSSRTFDVNANTLHNLTMSGSGSYVVSDATLTAAGTFAQSAGAITFGAGTTTIGASFNVTGGSFTHNGSPFVFTGSGAQTVRFNNSQTASLRFSGAGTFTMSDTNATSTGSVVITAGSVTLPSGNFAVGGSFEKRAGTLTHNTSELIMTSAGSALLTASSSDLFAVRFTGAGSFTITDTNITFLDSFTVANGSVLMASGTTAIGGSLTATGGAFTHATGTVLLNASGAGRTVNPGSNTFHNLQIGAPAGGYTLYSATTTNNFTIASANILTVDPTATVYVGGVFTNSVGGAGTTWTGSTLILDSQTGYSINTRSNSGDTYGTLVIGDDTDIRAWYSNASVITVASSGSLYSQDNANVNGALNIYGDLVLATSTEYWNYENDFDGTALTGGSRRAVTVSLAANATTTLNSGTLQIIGASGFETIIQNQGSGTYAMEIAGGTLNAQYYEFSDLNGEGLKLENTATITDLSNGLFDLAVDTGSLITLSSTTLNANPSKTFDNVGFTATTGISGFNINLTGETTNAWRITNNYGNIGGEGFDIDGIDACGSIRFDNSSCLLTEQTQIRFRADDGGEGAPDSEWFDQSFDYRTSVRVLNNDNQAYASTAVKVIVPYDSAMQSDFEDLRFTSSDGQTPVPFWLERYTASSEAQVWVRIPTLPASAQAMIYMYYGSTTATLLSNGGTTFDVIDDYEDNSISEYSGDTGLFTTVTTPVYGGTYALRPSNTSGRTTDGIFRFDDTVSQGQIIRYMQYVNTTTGSGDEPCTLFGVQSPGTTNNNYAVCLEQFGTDRLSLSKNVVDNDTSGTVLATSTVTYATGWYEVEIDWQTDDSIFVSLYNSAGTRVASTTATDSSYTSGGYGYTFWFQNGAWDSFTARTRVETAPTVFLGAKQTSGGANWISAQNGVGSAVPNDVVRLRVAVENSGLDVTAQQYRLEYAAKASAPTCESVSSGSYITVPNQASCGSSPVCMQTSSFVTNGAVTTDLLIDTEGTFTAGSVVTSPQSETGALDVDQNYYTELEYVITPTVNAVDSYCFRVTNAGTPLDFYAKVAELGLQFDPTFGAISLNGGLPISLTPGTTTAVTVLGTVTDFNGVGDIAHATATIYRSGAGAACTADNNNCYIATTENGLCSLTNCSGDSCDLSCSVDVLFHADPTDADAYEGEEWLAYAEAEDYGSGYDFASAPGVELITLRALAVDSLINYGALAADSDTGSFNPTTTVTNLGNVPINIDIEGNDLTDGGTSQIAADYQKVATSTFTYSACVSCQQLSTSTPVTLGINLSKPSVTTPPVETDVYWGIAVPFSASNAAHTGTNIFTAIGVD